MEREARRLLTLNPEDAFAKIALASATHGRMVKAGPSNVLRSEARRIADEDKIEQLVLSALPEIEHEPYYALTAAKLLYFVERGHRDLAV